MNIHDVIGELLYIGIVAERGRCYGKCWKFGYKKTLRRHVIELNKLQKCLQSDDKEFVKAVIEEFISVCNDNPEIGKFYNFQTNQVDKLYVGKGNIIIDRFIKELFLELTTEINRPIIFKKKVYYILCALHNLPRIYLGKDKATLCNLNQEGILERDAIRYSLENMTVDMKKKYQNMVSTY